MHHVYAPISEEYFRAVFLNCQAVARCRALASIILGHEVLLEFII
jgi:hypothetical protein